jgi:hypothetical protein
MQGERAHVCVLDDDGRLRCKWSYNHRRVRRAAFSVGCPDSTVHRSAPC